MVRKNLFVFFVNMFIFYLWWFFSGNSNCRKKNNPGFFRLKGNPLIPNSNCWSPTVYIYIHIYIFKYITHTYIYLRCIYTFMHLMQRICECVWMHGWACIMWNPALRCRVASRNTKCNAAQRSGMHLCMYLCMCTAMYVSM